MEVNITGRLYPFTKRLPWSFIFPAVEIVCVVYLLFFGLARLADARERHDVTVGTRLTFNVQRFDKNEYQEVKATCLKRGKHCYIFVDERYQVADELLTMAMIQFDFTIFPTVRTNFGIEWSPGVDGDYLIYILLTDLTDRPAGYNQTLKLTEGYYSIFDEMTATEIGLFNQEHGTWYKTNEKEVVFMDIDPLVVGSTGFNSRLARLFQRMVHYYQSTFGFENPRMEEEWVVTGCSLLAQYLCGYGIPEEYQAFIAAPTAELPEEATFLSDARAGGVFLLFLYMWEQFDEEEMTRAITSAFSTGIEGLGEALAPRRDVINLVYEETSELSEFDLEIIRKAFKTGYNSLDQFEKAFLSTLLFKSIYMDWLCALLLDDTTIESGRYGFRSFEIDDLNVPQYNEYPTELDDIDVESYAARLYDYRGNATNTLRFRMISDTYPEALRVRLVRKGALEPSSVTTVNVVNGWASVTVNDFGETYPDAYWVVGKVSGEETARFDLRAYLRGPVVAAFLSPIYKNMIIIDVKASDYPVVGVYQEGAPNATDVDMVKSPQGTYTGYYVLDSTWPGRGEISVRGTGVDFVNDEIIVPFEYQKEQSGTMHLGSVAGVELDLLNTTAGDGSVVLLVSDSEPSKELQPLSPVAQVLVRSEQLNSPGQLTFPLDSQAGSHGLGLFRRGENNTWIFERTASGETGNGRVRVAVSRPGRFAILRDLTRPRLVCREALQEDDGTLSIYGSVNDTGSGVDQESLSIRVGGRQLRLGPSSWNGSDFEVTVDDSIPAGSLVRVSVADRLGNASSAYVEVRQAVVPLNNVSMKAYPCPAVGNVTIQISVAGGLGAAASLNLTIRDVAGDIVMTADRADFTDQGGGVHEYVWNPVSSSAANGVYLYEISINDSGNTWNGRGKIVVLK